jgi:major inositol transporter-like SP family MFS transporter
LVDVGSLIFVLEFAPRTRGRSLEELEDDFRTHVPGEFVREAPVGVHGG